MSSMRGGHKALVVAQGCDQPDAPPSSTAPMSCPSWHRPACMVLPFHEGTMQSLGVSCPAARPNLGSGACCVLMLRRLFTIGMHYRLHTTLFGVDMIAPDVMSWNRSPQWVFLVRQVVSCWHDVVDPQLPQR